jgi:hypothetical protein
MCFVNRLPWCGLAMLLMLAPRPASAQAVAGSFEELRQILKNGQMVVVTDASGHRTKGKVRDLSTTPTPGSVVLLVPDARTFAESAVSEIRAADSPATGALIGGGVGFGLALWDYLIDPSEPDNAAIFAVAIGLGAAIGLGIDALIDGKVLYRPRQPRVSVGIAPLIARDRRGVAVSVRF